MDLDVDNVFFESLVYPEYVRPFFFIKKQKESGWHKGIFLASLNEIYHHYNGIFEWKFNISERKQNDLKIEDFKLPIGDEVDGKQKRVLTKQILEEQELAILTAYQIDKPIKEFSDIEIVTFAEYALGFIRNEFQIQTGAKDYKWFRPRTKTYFEYFIISEAPFIDFPRFKNAVRNLLWNGSNISDLKKTLENFYKAAMEIVEIWNNELFKLQQRSLEKEDKELPEKVRLEFNHETLNHSWWNDFPSFDAQGPKRFLNQDFADFAVRIVNFLASEIKGKKNDEVEVFHKDFIKDFLDGIHELKKDGVRQNFIKSIKNGEEKDEAPFADFFKNWFKPAGYFAEIEAPKSDGRIDLRVSHKGIGNKIIEFKGWWNSKKVNIVSQINNYITEFENEGFIFIIDDTKRGMLSKYKEIIAREGSGYISDSWEITTYFPTTYKFYSSKHKLKGETKTLYHFIFSIDKL